MAEDERSKFATQVAGRAEGGYPKILVTDDDGRLKVRLNFNPSPGSDHTASGIRFTDTAGEGLVFGNLCYMKSDGKWWKADADAIATMPGLALALATISANADGAFLKQGFIRDDSWGWTAGGLVYASTTPGGLTQTAPSGSGDVAQTVGFALTADIMHFKPSLALLDAAPVDGSIARAPTSDWAYGHAAGLDAHTFNIFSTPRVGQYYCPALTGRPQAATVLDAANRLWAMPFPLPRAMTFDRIACQVTAQAGEKIRMGGYSEGTNIAPIARYADAGEITLAGIGIQAIVINWSWTKGLHWVTIVSDGTPTLREDSGRSLPFLGIDTVNPTDWQSGGQSWYTAHAYGALPDPFGAVTGDYRFWVIALRVASLD